MRSPDRLPRAPPRAAGAPAPARPRVAVDFEAIGTHWQIDTDRALARCAVGRDRRPDRGFRPDLLPVPAGFAGQPRSRPAPGAFEFPADSLPLIAFYRRLYDLTGGAVTPLIGGTLEDLGYDADYRLTPPADPRGHRPGTT